MLMVFVEGKDDEAFIKSVFADQSKNFHIIQYACMKKEKLNQWLLSIENNPVYNDYLFLGDSDGKSLTECKNDLTAKHRLLKREKIVIVIYEIESWYYAGVDEENRKKLKFLKSIDNTDNLTKEKFLSNLPPQTSKQCIKRQILDCFSAELARTRNKSFDRFYKIITKKEPD
jgi:hypothetical protein